MATPLETYSAAILDYAETVRRARRIADVVNRAATALRNWEQVQVTDTAGDFPEEFRRSSYSENHVKGSEWPEAQQIADALLAYHRSKHDLEIAYSGIPEDQRHAVKAPDAVSPMRA
jgi:hypothetical protein